MLNDTPGINPKLAIALGVLVVAGSVLWPVLTARSVSSSNAPGSASAEMGVFEDIERALFAFSLVCLKADADFGSVKADLTDMDARVTELQRNGETHEIYDVAQLGGAVVFTLGDNFQSCGMTARDAYATAVVSAVDWFLIEEKAFTFPMFGKHADMREEAVTPDAQLWKLEWPDSDRVDLVQIKDRSDGLTSLSYTVIDFTR